MPRPEVQAPLDACLRGELAPNLALMRLVMAADSEVEAEQALGQAAATALHDAAARIRAARSLWQTTPALFETVKSVLRIAERGEGNVADWTAVFDSVASLSKEAGVALYSLGREDLLQAASREIVDELRAWGLLDGGRRFLEIGCGIGRLLPLLAAEAEIVVGLDISPVMLQAAAQRTRGCANVLLVRGSGDAAPFRDGAFDVVLAVDVFPYIVSAGQGPAARQFADAARLLKPGGSLIVMNYSYRGDHHRDRREIAELAGRARLSLLLDGTRPFRLWDGLCFHLRKPA